MATAIGRVRRKLNRRVAFDIALGTVAVAALVGLPAAAVLVTAELPVAFAGGAAAIGALAFLVRSWTTRRADDLTAAMALDVAMGNGRNAVYLATRGFDVDGVDVRPEVVEAARTRSRQLGAPIRAVVGNVEDGSYIIPIETYDVIVVFHYLHRPLFRDIRDGLKPGGVVVYQTYTTEQPRFGKPTNPAHLLKPGELQEAFEDFEILRYEEGIEPATAHHPPQAVASIVARKPE